MLRFLLLLLAVPVACLGQGQAEPGSPAVTVTNTTAGNQIIDAIVFDDIPLPVALQQLAKQAGVNCQIDPVLINQMAPDGTPIPPPPVREHWKNVSALQALYALSQNYGCQVLSGPGSNPRLFIYAGGPGAFNPPVIKVNILDKPPAGGPLMATTNGNPGDETSDVSFDDLPVTEGIRQLGIFAGLNIQFDPLLFNPADATHHPIPFQGGIPARIPTQDGRGWYVMPTRLQPTIPMPILNDRYTNVTPRQVLQKLLDKYGWQLTRITGNPILRVVAQDPKNPAAQGSSIPSK